MDWRLVLASQGIETTIDSLDVPGHYELIVPVGQEEPARAAIRQYRREMQRRGRAGTPETSHSIFDWSCLAWVVGVVLFFLTTGKVGLAAAGMMDSAQVAHGQWWRLFTAMWLHADAAHLAANVTFGVLVLGLVMGRYGAGVGMLTA